MSTLSIQDQYYKRGICFGCGPKNQNGLHIKSFPIQNGLATRWTPKPEHSAFPGILCGGIIGTILDCHSNWTAVWHLMQKLNLQEAPCCLTAKFEVKLKKPTPIDQEVLLESSVVKEDGPKIYVESQLKIKDEVYAVLSGTFIAVDSEHPANQTWKTQL